MPAPAAGSAIDTKTRELCDAIVKEPWFATVQSRIDSFMQDEKARAQYLDVNEKGRFLQEKQTRGLPITGEELAEFEKRRDELFSNPLARGFVEAQEEVQEMQHGVTRYVAMTFELGRLPSPEDLHSCSSGSCGCSH